MVDSVDPALKSLFRKSVQPYMISWLKYDPAIEIKELKIPILIIQGTTDIQISVEDAKLLAAVPSTTSNQAFPLSSNTKLVIIKNMNHVLKDCNEDLKFNISTYKNPDLPLNNPRQ